MVNEILMQLILGAFQGITEWIPVSSSGVITLMLIKFFGYAPTEVDLILRDVLFLHLGTFFAALIYFKKEVGDLFMSTINYRHASLETRRVLKFLIISTIITGIIGLVINFVVKYFGTTTLVTGKLLTFFVGILLLLTGIFQIKKMRGGIKREMHLTKEDGLVLGVVQGFAALPGLSRSGITVSTLLFRKFDDTTALRLSFLMSMPVVLLGNIFLNMEKISLSSSAIYGLLASFVFGIATIHMLMKVSKKINFGWFVFVFAILMLLSVFF